jgi:hypothetical protein
MQSIQGKQGKLQISGHAVSKRRIAESSADRMVLFPGVSFHPLQQKSALRSRSGIEETGSKKNFLCVETVATAAALHLEPGSKCRSRRCLSHPNTDSVFDAWTFPQEQTELIFRMGSVCSPSQDSSP